jgi:uncharacterized membrane protein YfcA
MFHAALLILGLIAGVLAGMFGIGGGLVIVPALMLIFRMKELDALGTSLAALIPPVGLLSAIKFNEAGHVNVTYAGFIALGLFVGGYFGARVTLALPPGLLQRMYGSLLLIISIRLLVFAK